MRHSWILAAALTLPLTACGDDGHGDHHHMTLECQGNEAGVDSVIAGTNLKVKLIEVPSPIDPELDLDFAVQILDGSDAPVDGATLMVEPWQPVHGHGVPVTAEVTPRGSDGEYDIARVHFLHPGRWELRFMVTSGTDDETITSHICVAGTPPDP